MALAIQAHVKCNCATSNRCKGTVFNPAISFCCCSEAEKTKREEERHSHHTGRASPRCGSSCAHPGPASDWKPCYTPSTGTASPAGNDNSEWKWGNAEPDSLKDWNSMLDGASFIFSPRYYSQWKQQKTTFKWLSESWESCGLTVSTSAPTYELIICSSLSNPAIWGVCFLSRERYTDIKFQCSFLYPPQMLKACRKVRLSTKTLSLFGGFHEGKRWGEEEEVQGKFVVAEKLILKSGDRRLITYSLQNLKRSADGNQTICIFIRTWLAATVKCDVRKVAISLTSNK